MKHLKSVLAMLLAAALLLGCPLSAAAVETGGDITPAATYNWVSTWTTAEERCDATSTAMPKSALTGTTVREIMRVTTTGEWLKLTFSNQYGNTDVVVRSLHIAKQVQADKSTIDTATDTVVTVDGAEEFTIPAGKTIETDATYFPVNALENVAVSMYFGNAPTSNITGHRGARATTYQLSGNQVSAATLTGAQTTTSWFFLCDAALDMPAGSKAIVCFGDSITDGYGTDASYLGKTPDSYTRWLDYFAKRLQGDEKTKNISVINEGIGTNAMLYASPTDSGKDRFARDLLEHDGVAYVIIHFGVNDLQKLSNTNKYSQMIDGYKSMVTLAHENGIKVFVAPILPFGTNTDYYSAASEQLRTMINDWFRSPESEVDAIIDFEGAVVDPANPINILEKYTHSDGLHPYDGYSAMADAIDLSLFYEGGVCEHEYDEVVTAPTCLEGGYTTYTCKKCGATRKGNTTAALGHSWDDGKVTTPPTEATNGVMTFTCTRCGETKTKRINRLGVTVPDDIDFKQADAVDCFELVNPDVSEIRAGQGLYMITTKDGFEPANDQLTGDAATTPRDLVLIPVEGDWQATLKFTFNQGSASNGYYQFFGFYAMQDYDNCAGIRGGNGAMQDFIRLSGAVTHETQNSEPGLASNGTYWYRITKEDTTYTCARSSDGEAFTDMFSYTDTGIDADKIAIDAYTGMTAGYTFLLDTLTFEEVGGVKPHEHSYTAVVTAPTCEDAGYTTYTCTCGDTYKGDEVAALGHDYEAKETPATCTEPAGTTYTCKRCGDSYTEAGQGGTGPITDVEITVTCPSKYSQQTGNPTIIKETYYSKTTECNRNANVQLPPNYDETKEYPVMFVNHGIGGNQDSMLNYRYMFNNLMLDGTMPETIIVYCDMFAAPEGVGNRMGFNAETMRYYDAFPKSDLPNDLLPYILSKYPVKEGKANTAVCGFSQGGRESLTAGLFHPEIFGYVGGFSPAPGIVPGKDSFMTHEGTFKEDEVNYEGREAPYLTMICCGDADTVVGQFPKSYHELYTKNGIPHTWWEIPGSGHGDPATSSGIYNFCKYVFKAEGSGSSEPLGHDYKAEITAPNCTEEGYTTYTCSRCGDTYIADETAALGHSWDNGVVTKEATETAEGVRTFTCTRCKETKTEAIAKLTHTHNYAKVVTAPTCTEKGFTTYTCACGDTYKDNELAALGHSWDEGVVTKEATEDEEGIKTFTCSRCKETKTESIAKLSHTHNYAKVVTAPTCTEKGFTTYTCACGDTYKADEVAALGHDYKAVVTAPTCEAVGFTTYTCTRCADTYKADEVAALGHSFVNGVCTRCGAKDPSVCDGGDSCPSKDFSDVPAATDWAHAGIDYCVKNELMNGTSATVFAPNGSVTRAQLVTILYRIAGKPAITTANTFTDVKPGVWYYEAIEWAAANKIVNGQGDGIFNPDGKITREQIATILYRYAGSSPVDGSLSSYPDQATVSTYAVDAMIWATGAKLITGVNKGGVVSLDPRSNATRAQIAAIIMRFLTTD